MIYKKGKLNYISFPLGGIGSGSIGLGGDGRLVDWEIFNRPNKFSRNGYSHIAIKAKHNGGSVTKVLNADLDKDFIGEFRHGIGYGPDDASMCGFPHFKNVTFKGEFPIAELCFEDDAFPGKVNMTAFNPFIPLDDKNSSIPGAFFEIVAENTTSDEIEYQVGFTVNNPYEKSRNISGKNGKMTSILLKNDAVAETETAYGDLTIATDCENSYCQSYWYRGMCHDFLVTYWDEFTKDKDMPERVYDEAGNRDIATLVAKVKTAPGEKKTIRFILTWNVPNNYNYWNPYRDEDERDISWKNYYAVLFENSLASAKYSLDNWDSLYERTYKFKEAIYTSTLDEALIDSVAANLSVLKSPTVLRLEDGSFYGWEGVCADHGSCEGTCQHVWSYAYALCFLFPKLERSIRDAEIKYSMDENGKTEFRLRLPYGREGKDFGPCLDGQMSTVFKMYREWKISGDNEWLKSHWESIKLMLEFAWSDKNPDRWDFDKDGVLEGRQHHTLDMELYGPSSWLEGMYLLALKAAAEMAHFVGEEKKAQEYIDIFQKGYDWTKQNLFNGNYFIQKIDIKDKEILNKFSAKENCWNGEALDAEHHYWNGERNEIKYQIANGSEIDQMLAQWHSDILGLGAVYDKEQIKTALLSMMKINFKESMRDFESMWRIYALNDEAGTVMCDYPEGAEQPLIPIPYTDEVMTGFEYSFAGLLASNGMIDEALKVVKAVRNRYDGSRRNPWNELECGSNYARSMASFAFLPIFSGFEFDMPNNHIGFNPIIRKDDFKSFWSLETGWGTYKTAKDRALFELSEGEITLSSFGIKHADNISAVIIDDKPIDYTFENGVVCFDKKTVNNRLELVF